MDTQNVIKLPESKFIQLPECEGELPQLHTIVTYKGRAYSYEGCDPKQKHTKKREVFLVKVEENTKKAAQPEKSVKPLSKAKARGKQEIIEAKAAGGTISTAAKGSELGVKIALGFLYGSSESVSKEEVASFSSFSTSTEIVRQEPQEIYAKYSQESLKDASQAIPERNFKAYRQNCIRHHPPVVIFSKLDSLVKTIFFSEELNCVQVMVPLKVLEVNRKGSPRICEKEVLEIGLNEDGKAIHVFLREVKTQEGYAKYRELKGKPSKTTTEAKLKTKKKDAALLVSKSQAESSENNKHYLFSIGLDKIPRQWALYLKTA